MEQLRIQNISKVFGGNKALDSINLSIESGKVHSLVGENGAGKSTLIKIITGVYQPTEGELFWKDKQVKIDTPSYAHELGINAIHQDRQLVSYFNGLENLFLNSNYPLKKNWIGINWRKMKQEAEELKHQWGIEVPLDVPVSKMTPSQQTLLEILRAMSSESKVLILDEPTASLTDKESELLFSFIDRLKNKGVAIIYISHRLEEVIRISDKVTVLTGGKLIKTLTKDELTKEKIIHYMTDGQTINALKKATQQSDKERPTLLEVTSLKTKDRTVKNVSFTVRGGEILGVYGLAGSGRTESLEAIYGLRQIEAGVIKYKDEVISTPTPKKLINHGIIMIPENRIQEGLIMGNTIKENMTLPILDLVTKSGRINRKEETKLVDNEMERFKVKATNINQPVSELSGGNQQKVVFGKALLTKPDIFLSDEPTQAVDIMTRSEIHTFLKEQAESGKGVVFVSSDLNEILEVSDRVLVFSEGETVTELANENLTTNQILDICYNFKKEGVIN